MISLTKNVLCFLKFGSVLGVFLLFGYFSFAPAHCEEAKAAASMISDVNLSNIYTGAATDTEVAVIIANYSGVDFDHFYSSATIAANATDLSKIALNGVAPTSGTVISASEARFFFAIDDVGTAFTSFSADVDVICNATDSVCNTASNPTSMGDLAKPVLRSIVRSVNGSGKNVLTFTYSEAVNATSAAGPGNGASTSNLGDMTIIGTIAGFGAFSATTSSDVTVPNGKNSITGSGTTAIVLTLANESGGYLDATSATQPSGTFVPSPSSSYLADAASNGVTDQVSKDVSGSNWDLTKPAISAAVMRDDSSNDGIIDKVRLTWDEQMSTASSATNGFSVGGTDHGCASAGTAEFTGPSEGPMDVNLSGCNVVKTVVGDLSLSFDNAATTIIDRAGNIPADVTLNSGTSPAITDGVGPFITAITVLDSGGDGKLDSATLTFTENLADTTAGANGFDVTTIGGHGTCDTESTDPSVSTSLTLTFSCSGVDTDVEGLTISFTTNAGIKDAAVAQTPTKSGGFTSESTPDLDDGAAPVLNVLRYEDSSGDGTVDQVTITYSETVTAGSVLRAADLLFTEDGDFNGIAFGGATEDLIIGFVTSTTITLGTATVIVDTHNDGSTIAFSTRSLFSLTDGVNENQVLGVQTQITENDNTAPIVIDSATRDGDSNGKIDGIDITFSEGMDEDGIEESTGSFSVSDYVGEGITTGASENDQYLRITFTEGGSADTDATPTITYDDGSGALSDLFGSLLVSFESVLTTDAAAPYIVGSNYYDNNGNGTIDYLVLVFSEDVDDSEYVDSSSAISAGGTLTTADIVAAAIVALDAAADDKWITLAIAGGAANVTNVTGTFDTFAADMIEDLAGISSLDQNNVTMTDKAAPVILSGRYLDNDASGEIDRLEFTTTTDTGLACTAYAGNVDLTVDAAGEVGLARNAADTCADNNTSTFTITLNTVGTSNTTGGATAPVVDYTQPGDGLEDGAGNDVPTYNNLSVTDGAAPIALSSAYKDTGTPDARIDRLDITFSEAIVNDGYNGDDYAVSTAGSVIALEEETDVATSGNDLQINTLGAFNITGGGTDPRFTYTSSFANGSRGLNDASNNAVATFTSASDATDSAAPKILTRTYLSNGSNGSVDRLRITFSEVVTDNGSGLSQYAVAAQDLTSFAGAPTAVADSGTATLTYTVAATTNLTGVSGGTEPTVAYMSGGTAGNRVQDGSNNFLANSSATGITDGANPFAYAATFYDATSSDGKLDKITVLYTETISDVANGSGDWAISSAANFAGFVEGTVECSTGGAAANACNYNFTTTTVKTSVGDLTLAYTAGTSVTDGANTAASATFTGVSSPAFTDGAKPAIVSITTSDTTGDGTVDQLTVAFSESVDIVDTGLAADGFDAFDNLTDSCTISNQDLTSNSVTSKAITVSGCTAGNTSILVELFYNLGGGDPGIFDEATAPNEMADSETITSGTDGAKPAIRIAATYDSDADGTVDRLVLTFSESVTVTDGVTDNDITLVASTGTATITAGAYGTTGTTLTYTISGATAGNTSLTITPTYATAGAGDITDANSNEMANSETVTGTDGAAPAVTTATFYDANSDGLLDKITLAWSEAVVSVDATDDFATTGSNFGTLTQTSVNCGGAGTSSTTTCDDLFTTTTIKTNVGNLVLGYTGSLVMDSLGNEAGNLLLSTSDFTDAAAPVIKTFEYQDNSGDGKIDRMVLDYSEEVAASSFLRAIDLVFLNDEGSPSVGDFTGAAFGTATTDLITIAVTQTTVGLGTASSVADTAEGSEDLMVTTRGLFSLVDSTGNTNSTKISQNQATFVDGAKPALISIVKSTPAHNVLTLTYSEIVTVTNGVSSGSNGDIDVAGVVDGFGTFVTAGTAGDVTVATGKNTVAGDETAIITITLADQTGGYLNATSTTAPSGVFTPVAAAAVVDGASNQVNTAGAPTVSGSWDVTKPTIFTAVMQDNSSNDGIIDRIALTWDSTMAVASAGANGFAVPTDTSHECSSITTTPSASTAMNLTLVGCSLVNTALGDLDISFTQNTAIQDTAGNLAASDTSLTITDGASPILTAVVVNKTASRNTVAFTYSEAMTAANGASTTTKGDLTTAGTVAGFGDFATDGNTTVPTLKNSITGSGGTTITITLANETGGYINSGSSAGPSDDVTPLASASVVDANSNQVNTSAAVVSPTVTAWTLTQPTITSITIADGDGDNGKVNRATIIFSAAVRDANITDADALLGGATHAGTFTSGTADNESTAFFLTSDNLAVDTSATAAQFTYSGATTKITDLFGNLLNTATDGTIVDDDKIEVDGARPIVVSVTKSVASNKNVLTIVYSEQVTLTCASGVSTSSCADMTSFGTLAGFGVFETIGDVTVPTTKNTVIGSGTSTITITLAGQSGGYLSHPSTTGTEPTLTFTPDATEAVVDAVGLQVNESHTVETAGDATWDVVKPSFSTYQFQSSGSNGTVDRIVLGFDEAVSYNGSDLSQFAINNRDLTGFDSNGVPDSVSGSGSATLTFVTSGTTNVTGGTLQPVVTIAPGGTAANWLMDSAGNPFDGGLVVLSDNAAPIIVSKSPASGAAGVSSSASVVITYSEPMTISGDGSAADATTSSPSVGTLSHTWTSGNTVDTITHSNAFSGAGHYTIAVAGTAASAASGDAALASTSWSFDVSGGGGGGGGGGASAYVAPVTSCTLTYPNAGASLTGGTVTTITWSSSGTGIADASLYYSVDSGASYGLIVAGTANDGSQMWIVPNTATTKARVKAECRDAGGGTVATGASNGDFTIASSAAVPVAPAPVAVTPVVTTPVATAPVAATPTATPSVQVPSVTPAVAATVSAPASAPAPIYTKDLKVGATGADVVKLQEFLIAKKLLVMPRGVKTGTYGNVTRDALKKLQAGWKLPATGVLDAATRKALNPKGSAATSATVSAPVVAETPKPSSTSAAVPTAMLASAPIAAYVKDLKVGAAGADVVKLQEFLIAKKLLVMPDGVDTGTFGGLTRDALKKLQAGWKLPATGVLDAATRKALNGM